MLDNEVLQELKQEFAKKRITHELVPSHTHRRNLAEKAIQTFKCRFLAGLASLDPTFPIAE